MNRKKEEQLLRVGMTREIEQRASDLLGYACLYLHRNVWSHDAVD
jgi:hypothetical protein